MSSFAGRPRPLSRPGLAGLCLIVMLQFSAAAAFAFQLPVGSVRARDDGPVVGARIHFEGGALTAPVEVVTDADGRYELPPLDPGTYTVVVTADGYADYRSRLQLRPRQTTLPPILLVPTRVSEQVLVTAPPALEARHYSSGIGIDPSVVESLAPTRTQSFAALVPQLSSSAVTGHDNLVHLRGNELSLNLSIQGVSFLDNVHPQFSPALTPDLFDSMELISGGFAPEFGGRFGGILDLSAKTGFGEAGHGSATFGGGRFDRANGSVQWGDHGRDWGYLLSGTAMTSDRYVNPPQPESLHNRGSGGAGFARFDRRSGRDRFSALLHAGTAGFELPNTEAQQQAGRDATKDVFQQTFIGTWDRRTDAGSLSVGVYQRVARERINPTADAITTFADGERRDWTYGAKADYSTFAGRHVIRAGVDGKILHLNERLVLGRDGGGDPDHGDADAVSGRHSGGAGAEHLDFDAVETGSFASAYVQDEAVLAPGLVANFGLRFDSFEMLDRETQLSPRVNLAYDPGFGLRAHAAYNRFFSPPPIEFLLLSSQATAVLPQQVPAMRADHFEAGVGYRFGNHLIADVTGYYRSSDNAFETGEIADARIFIPVTFAHDESRGLETSLRLLETNGVSGFLSYTLAKTDFIGPISGGLSDEEIDVGQRIFPAFDQRHTVAAGLRYRYEPLGLWFGARGEYGSGTPVEVGHGDEGSEGHADGDHGEQLRRSGDGGGGISFERLPSRFLLNLSVGIDIWTSGPRTLSLDAHVDNLLDEEVSIAKESALTPIQFGDPRAFSVRLRYGW